MYAGSLNKYSETKKNSFAVNLISECSFYIRILQTFIIVGMCGKELILKWYALCEHESCLYQKRVYVIKILILKLFYKLFYSEYTRRRKRESCGNNFCSKKKVKVYNKWTNNPSRLSNQNNNNVIIERSKKNFISIKLCWVMNKKILTSSFNGFRNVLNFL